MRKILIFLIIIILSSCSKRDTINSITREEGSGTRGAFVDLFELKEDGMDKIDDSIEVTNSTISILTSVKSDKNAMGYISFGSLNDNVKSVKIDNIEPSIENIKNGKYSIIRNLNIVIKEKNELINDFIKYINSTQAKEIIEKNGYVSIDNNKIYKSSDLKGEINIIGSSSVAPIMQKLAEDYMIYNEKIIVKVGQSDSTSGINSVLDGTCDIGMSSRELKETEINKGLESVVVCKDGIIIIINKEQKIDNLTKKEVYDIYTKKIESWDRLYENK